MDKEYDLPKSKLEAIRRGDAVVWAALHKRLKAHLNRVASRGLYRDMRPKLDPSDIVQDTFMLAHRSAARFRGSNLVEMLAWFHAILRNRLARAVRDQKYTQKRALHRELQRSPSVHPSKSIVDSDTPSHLAQDNEERELLDLAFQNLSEVDRLLITDHYINGLSFTELAQKSGRTEAALRKHWSRAMTRWCRGTQLLAGINPRINL